MTDGTLGSTLLDTRTVASTDEQYQVLLLVAFHVKRQRGTSVDLLQLVEMLGLEEALASRAAPE